METSSRPKISLSKVTAGFLFGAMLLAGILLQTTDSAGASIVSPTACLRAAPSPAAMFNYLSPSNRA
jgi:hypothetical protein